jgi:hypothetical protein
VRTAQDEVRWDFQLDPGHPPSSLPPRLEASHVPGTFIDHRILRLIMRGDERLAFLDRLARFAQGISISGATVDLAVRA